MHVSCTILHSKQICRDIVCLFLLVASSGMLGCRKSTRDGLWCKDAVVEVGIIHKPKLELDFDIENKSDGDIRVTGIEVSCACLSPDVPSNVVKAGETTTLRMIADIPSKIPWQRVPFTHSLTIFHDRSPDKPLVLVAHGTYVPPVCILHDTLTLELNDSGGKKFRREFQVFLAPNVEVTHARSDQDWIRVTLTSNQDQDRNGITAAKLSVTGEFPETVDRLPFGASVVLTTTFPSMTESRIPLVLVGPESAMIEKFPSRMACGVLRPNELCDVDLMATWSTFEDFVVKKIDAPSFVTCVDKIAVSNGQTHLTLKCSLRAPESAIAIDERICVTLSNSTCDKVVIWPVSGVVRR